MGVAAPSQPTLTRSLHFIDLPVVLFNAFLVNAVSFKKEQRSLFITFFKCKKRNRSEGARYHLAAAFFFNNLSVDISKAKNQ